MNPATEDLTRRYGRIITGLLDTITAHNRVLPAWLFPVLNKLFFATHIRVINLFAKLLAGVYRPHRPRATPRAPATRSPPPPGPIVPEGQPQPTGWRWLIRLLPPGSSEAAKIAGAELADLLAEPAMADLFTAAPALRRHLRPLCRALGVALPGEPAPTPPELDPPTPPPGPPITPLPPGMVSINGGPPEPPRDRRPNPDAGGWTIMRLSEFRMKYGY